MRKYTWKWRHVSFFAMSSPEAKPWLCRVIPIIGMLSKDIHACMHTHTHTRLCMWPAKIPKNRSAKSPEAEFRAQVRGNWKQRMGSNTICFIKTNYYKDVTRKEEESNISVNKLTALDPSLELYLEIQSKPNQIHFHIYTNSVKNI